MFNEKTEKLIKDIANQYIEIFKIVKKTCPKDFTYDEVILMFVKTESMFNNIQLMKTRKNKKKNHNNNNKKRLPKEGKRTKDYYA